MERAPGFERSRPPVHTFGNRVFTASDAGIVIEPGTIALASGTFTPEPRVDPSIAERIAREGSAFALIQIEGPLLSETFDRLHELGISTWAVLPHQAIQAYIPASAMPDLQALPEVRWVGTVPSQLKIHPALQRRMNRRPNDEPLPAWVSLLGEEEGGLSQRPPRQLVAHVSGQDEPQRSALDPNPSTAAPGRFQRRLESIGIEVHFYRKQTRNFAITATPDQIRTLSHLNEVHYLEDRSPVHANHDSSIPLIGQDFVRALFDGFSTEVGCIDSGLNVSHNDLLVQAVAWDTTALGPWNDLNGHGTHVSGTILGNGVADDRFGGNAPGIGDSVRQRFFVGRYLNNAPRAGSVGDVNDLYTAFSSNFTDVNGDTTLKPKIVNCSWGRDPNGIVWSGTEQACIDVDSTSWSNRQLYVFAAGNIGPGAGTVGRPGVAKNVLTVGNVRDEEDAPGDNLLGTIWTSSSRGPTNDNRMKPEITAPGRQISSPDTNNANGYINMTGTSMAAPHVTGLLACLNDHYQVLNHNPKLLRAWALASSLPKGGKLPPGSTYGFGTINAPRMHWSNAHSRLEYLAHKYVNESNRWLYWDVDVPAGTERLTLVLTWNEPPLATPGGATPIMANIDLYLDYHNNQSGGNTGNVSSTGNSNLQFIVVDNPPAGQHRIKFWPRDTDVDDNGSIDDLYFSAVMNLDFTDVEPRIALETTVDDRYLQTGDDLLLSSTVTTPSHVASSTMLNLLNFPNGLRIRQLDVPLKDGRTLIYPQDDRDVVLGAIPAGESRQATWTIRALTEGTYVIRTKANNDNGPENWGHSEFRNHTVYVDDTPPNTVSQLRSSTHPAGQWTSRTDFRIDWNPANDDRSGIQGYSYRFSLIPLAPDQVRDVGPVTSVARTLSEGTHYFTIRSQDRSDNWDGDTVHYGPIRIDRSPPSLPSNLRSSTHPIDTYISNSRFEIAWNASRDTGSGLDGYGTYTSNSPSTRPGATKDIEEVTQTTETLADGTWYFKLRPVDELNHFHPDFARYGPIRVDTTPPHSPFLTIDSGNAYSLDLSVDLTLHCQDATSGVTEMRFSNDGSAFSPWEPFAERRLGWNLASYGGNSNRQTHHEVFVQFRDAAGNRSLVISDQIYLAASLEIDELQLSRTDPERIKFSVNAGQEFAGRPYILVGTVSGTSPGMDLASESGGVVNLPLNRDRWTTQTLRGGRRGDPAFADFRGTLSSDGRALGPVLHLAPKQLDETMVGRTMTFAYVVLGPGRTVAFVSDPVSLQIVD